MLMGDRFDAPVYLRGAALSGASLTTALTSAQLDRLLTRFSEKTLPKAAFLLYAVGLFAVPFAPNLYLLLIPAVLFGKALGIDIPNVSCLLLTLTFIR